MSTAQFDLEFVNVPDNYLFEKASKTSVDVRLRAIGFQFLRFNFKNKQVFVDLSELEQTSNKFFSSPDIYKKQIERQLPGTMALLDIDNDTLYFDMLAVTTKKVPVKARVELDLAKNYLLDGKMNILPDSIEVTGPKGEIDTIDFVSSAKLRLPDLASGFSESVDLLQSPELENTSYSTYKVQVNGEIARFSEKVYKLPIKKINFPKGVQVRTFPENVSVLCKAKIKVLKEISEEDFQVIADYRSLEATNNNVINVKLTKTPEGLHSSKLLENEVEFILKRE